MVAETEKIGKYISSAHRGWHTHTHTHILRRCQARFWLKSALVIDSAGCSIHPSMNSQPQPVYNNLSLTEILLLELNRDHMMERLRADIKKRKVHTLILL